MAYKCEILADSISEQGHRLTTFKLTYPRIIHAEMLRHRMLSRNVASSRAIPFEKMVKDIEEDPFIPLAWQKSHKGMQGTEYLQVKDGIYGVKEHWLEARNKAVELATSLHSSNVTKQLVNRIIEPFVWTTELVSGTEWENFFELRCPKYQLKSSGKYTGGDYDVYLKSKKDWIKERSIRNNGNQIINPTPQTDIEWLKINQSQAEIHIQKIAEMMWDTMSESVPKQLKPGDWHIPYGEISMSILDQQKLSLRFPSIKSKEELKCRIATARAARISYTTLGDNPKIDYEADIKLHDRLLEYKHLSCFEHCARVMTKQEYAGFHLSQGNNDPFDERGKDIYGVCGNYRGFIQYRYLIENQ